MKIAEVLRTAKSYIDKPEKWCKGRYHTDNYEQHCSVGAVSYVRKLDLCEGDEMSCAIKLLCGEGDVVSFNDRADTTHEDVMRRFDKTIALAELVDNEKEGSKAPDRH